MKKMIYSSPETVKKPTFKQAHISVWKTTKRVVIYSVKTFACISLLQIAAIAQPRVLPKIAVTSFKKDTFNIQKFGAKPDGKQLNTQAIDAAMSKEKQ